MSSDDKLMFFLLFIMCFGTGFATTLIVKDTTTTYWKKQCIDAKVAYYEVDAESGKVTFKFKEVK